MAASAKTSRLQGHASPGIMKRIGYRASQFFASLRPATTPEEQAELAHLLPPPAVDLFRRMAVRDQRHSLDVLRALVAAGHDQPDLLAAALLHDVAKTVQPGRRLRLGHRVVIVLMNAARPGLVQQLARNDPSDWRYPFYVHLHHPEMGAALVRQAGCSELTASLVARHQVALAGPPACEEDRLLALLQAADNAH